MGCRLHIAKKYDVEYSSYERFNWQQQEFGDLLESLEIQVAGNVQEGGIWQFEVSKEHWLKGIEKLEEEDWNDEINEAIEKFDYSREEIIEIMKTYYKESDQNSDFMFFCFY